MTTPKVILRFARARSGNSRRVSSTSSPIGCGRTDLSPTRRRQSRLTPITPKPTPAEEAAWQVLKPFINPIDCNHFVSYMTEEGLVAGVRAMNTNSLLNALLNHEPVKPKYFGKRPFCLHCRGKGKYYYRSQWNGTAITGYGGYASAWKK